MKQLLALFLCSGTLICFGQFKADNVKYKTVYPEDLCKTLQANSGYVILDVRSDAEFNDTMSASPSLNIGHLQNAKHIDIRQLSSRWRELSEFRDKPLFIYCSHSQRSRRASRMLADSGFTNIFNINGGLTNFYDQGIEANPCNGYKIVSSFPYKIVSSKELMNNIKKGTSYFIVDIRSDSIFNGTDASEAAKLQGKFAMAANVPFEKFKDNNFAFPSKPILLVDEFGSESPVAAKMLMDNGYKDVSILFDGMAGWTEYTTNASEKPLIKWSNYSNYNLLSPDEFNKWMKDKKNFTLVDVRPKDQYNNQSKNYFQNIGQIKNATNIPASEFANNSGLPSSKSDPVVLYGFNSEDEIFNSAKWLKDNGYKNVFVLQGGIWNLRWASHNLKNKLYLNDWVVNVPAENE
jgi:rhodanese-related sulfurtransferase